MRRWGEKWTVAEVETLKANWGRPLSELMALTGRSRQSLYSRARKVGLPTRRAGRYYRAGLEPTFEEWLQAAKEEARAADVPMQLVVGGDTRRAKFAPAVARWRAWRRLKANGRSLAGIGRATGWHHTSIMHGLRRLEEIEHG